MKTLINKDFEKTPQSSTPESSLIADFIYQNGSIAIPGSYDLPKEHFRRALFLLISTGEDQLSLHKRLQHLAWDFRSDRVQIEGRL